MPHIEVRLLQCPVCQHITLTLTRGSTPIFCSKCEAEDPIHKIRMRQLQ